MRKFCLFAIIAISLFTPLCAAPKMQQITTTSWHGLSGLFVMPTARVIGRNNFAVGFNESKHTEFINNGKFVDRQIRGVATFGVTDWLEISGTFYNNMYMIPPDRDPQLHNQTFNTFSFKARLMKEDPHYWYPEVSVGVRDIFGNTANVGPLQNVNNGTKGFIVVSKRMLKDPDLGRFMDVHLAACFDKNTFSPMAGFELTLSPNSSLIVEAIYDSPYLNFRSFGHNNEQGRFLLNPGVRIYPELVPGMALDLGFVGDSEFEFSFGVSYKMSF